MLIGLLGMEKLFTTTFHVSVLSSLTIRDTKCMTRTWHKIQQKYIVGSILADLKAEGTQSLAEQLYEAGLTYNEIKDRYIECASNKQFIEWLKFAGIRHKVWHEELNTHFKKECKNK